nr:hypothetical protein [Paenibacillus luteus]
MNSSFNTFPLGNMENSFKNVMDLHRAGVDILVGTDVTPVPVRILAALHMEPASIMKYNCW